MTDNMSPETDPKTKTFTEQIEVAGKELVEQVQKLIEEGNVRRVIIKHEDGRELMQFSLTAGAVVGGVLVFAAPLMAALGAAAAFLARVKIEIIREEMPPTE
jgi:hypothetical protein